VLSELDSTSFDNRACRRTQDADMSCDTPASVFVSLRECVHYDDRNVKFVKSCHRIESFLTRRDELNVLNFQWHVGWRLTTTVDVSTWKTIARTINSSSAMTYVNYSATIVIHTNLHALKFSPFAAEADRLNAKRVWCKKLFRHPRNITTYNLHEKKYVILVYI
jgi:hypothetical protein